MIQKVLSFAKKTLSVALFMAIAVVFFVSCGKSETAKGYTVSGYIYDEFGMAVEGVDVKSEVGTVQTNADGKFTFENVDKGIILEPSKEGYFFPESSKMVMSATSDANFSAYEIYTARGVVLNSQNIGVQNAVVTLDSLVGTYYSVTDEEGRFSAEGVAGEAEISCVSEDFEYFFPVKTSITNQDVKLNITKTNLTIKFNFDSDSIDLGDVTIKINDQVQSFDEVSPVFEDVKYNSRVQIESDKYVFQPSIFIVKNLNQVQEINAYKLYNVDGVAKSGSVMLSGAEIYLNGEKLSRGTDASGNFSLNNLYGENEISVKYGSLEFESQVVTNANDGHVLQFNGTKSVFVDFEFDYNTEEIAFSSHDATLEGAGRYKIDDLTLGETIEFSSENYELSAESVEVGEADTYTVSALRYYSANISIKNGMQVTILLDGEEQPGFSGTIEKLFGSHSVSASLPGYEFSICEINYLSHDVEIDYMELYDVTLVVKSGEIELDDASATYLIDGEQTTVSAESGGTITLANLKGTVSVTISATGYDSTVIQVSEVETKQVNLTYSVQGLVATVGGTSVEGVLVSAGEASAQTDADGFYTLSNLSGEVSISANLEYYNFGDAKANITKQTEVNFSGTYTVKGVLSAESSIEGYKVCLIDDETTIQVEEYVVGADGEFIFENLTGTYFLLTKDASGNFSKLRPNSYNVSLGGNGYNFNLSGFSVSGYVTTGEGHPVAGANVYAGSQTTKTDERGYYEFPLLTGETEISVELRGYNFPEKINVSEDSENVNFDGTFSVEGTVKLADQNLDGVEIYNGERVLGTTTADGSFTVSGLSGEVELEFKKEGYHFDGKVSVDKYQTLSVTCKIVAKVQVKSGDLDVSNYKVYVGGGSATVVEGAETTLIVDYGAVITFEKEGYEILSQSIIEPNTYVVQATYSVSGKVLSGNVEISGVKVSVGGNSVITGADGSFTLTGLSGEVLINFEKDGFEFGEAKTATGYQKALSVQGTYGVSGTVKFNSVAMAGVVVTLEGTENTVTTGASGEFAFSGVSGRFSLSFEKTGYTFDSVDNQFGVEPLDVTAYFSVSGRVATGSIGVVGAEIVVSFSDSRQKEYYQSGVNGEFTITGLSGSVTLIISKSQYTSAQIDNISDHTEALSVNLKYSVSFGFDTEGVTIEASSGKTYNCTGKSFVTPLEFEGEVTFTFKKTHTSFTPASVTATGPASFENIGSAVAYNNVKGRIVIEGTNIGVEGMTVYAGSESINTKTNKDGYFEFDIGVAGKVGINEFGYKALIAASVKDDGEIPTAAPFTIPQLDFFVYIYNKSISNLDNASSVQIYGSGTVKPSIGGDQNIKTSFKRDNTGSIIKQNLNYGEKVSLVNVDPRVALVVGYDSKEKSEKKYKYSEVRGDSVGQTSANYGKLSQTDDRSTFYSTYGSYPENYSPYIINKDTIDKIDSLSKSGDTFTIVIHLKTKSQPNYHKQISALSPGSEFKEFTNLMHTYEINKDGWIKSLITEENYNIFQIMPVSVGSVITYNYYTNTLDKVVPDIEFDDGIQKSLSYEDPNADKISNLKKLDVVTNLIGTGR